MYDARITLKQSRHEYTTAKKYKKKQKVNAMVHYTVDDILIEDKDRNLSFKNYTSDYQQHNNINKTDLYEI